MEEKDKKKNVENRKEGKNLKIIINLTNKQFLGGGRNVEFQNVNSPKISERRNGLFS